MKQLALVATAIAAASGTAHAGGLDRSGTPIGIIFETGNYAELSYGYTDPSLTGIDAIGTPIRNIASTFGIVGAGLKLDVSETVSLAFILDQPYGVDVEYGPETPVLGGTLADAESYGLTTLVRYKATDRISVYGGPRFVRAEGEVNLGGLAYGPANGYRSNYASDTGTGYVIGAAYEIPDIAFRAALTYHSEIDLAFNTTETFPNGFTPPSGITNTTLPQTIKLAVQSGIAEDTLAFGSIRWADHSEFSLVPPVFQTNLADLDNTTTYELGVGRRFTDRFSARTSVIYEDGGSDDLVSPLAPTNGFTALTVGGQYQVTEAVDISGGIRYTWLKDARPQTGGAPRGSFRNNDALSLGVKLGVRF